MTLLLLALLACRHTPPQAAAEVTLEKAPVGDPIARLEEGSRSTDVSVRMRSLELLIRFAEEPGGGDWGPRALYDPSPYVKRAAVDALASRLPEPEAQALLRDTVQRENVDPYVRGHAGLELARVEGLDEASRAALDEAWRSERLHWRRAPLALAAAAGGDPEALTQAAQDLARGDFPLEMTFFLDIGRSGLTELAEPLVQGHTFLEPELDLPVAMSLIRLGDKRGEQLARQALDGELALRMEVVDFAVTLEGEAGSELLRKARQAGPSIVRDYAELALIARGEGAPGEAIEALQDPDRERRQQAAWALAGWISQQEGRSRSVRNAYKALVGALADPEPVVVEEAVRGLALVGRPSDRELLSPLVSAETLGLSVEAAGAILAIDASDGAVLAMVE